ncbi:pyruvate kinase [Bacteroidales bacterium OttesenSCG-928-L19]|nr:pyruvate kinase [Bacteroidales bacterium OttesenSCG-928-L19]
MEDIKTKLVATIGPATSSEEMIDSLILRGVNVFRLNLSHESHENHRKTIHLIRKLTEKHKAHIAILTDLQGPKLRIGDIEQGEITLVAGKKILLTTKHCNGDEHCLHVSYKDFPQDVEPGEAILIDDGKIKLKVLETDKKENVLSEVIYGGKLTSRKGINLPNTKISLPSLTEKDMADALFAIEEEVNWIGLSFVRSAEDLKPLRALIHSHNKHISIIAKIEKPEAFSEIDEIITEADAIMVARGDLGVEMSFDQVPMLQKMIVRKCLQKAKPVIIATQMMESMIANFRPTRAEANDVANSVMDGADAVMLSGETSIGAFPCEAVDAMRQIVAFTENNGYQFGKTYCLPDSSTPAFIRDSICYNAYKMAEQMKAKVIVAFTNSGYTAMKIASYRPQAKIFAFTNNRNLVNKMPLLWGTKAYYYEDFGNMDLALAESVNQLKKEKILNAGDMILHVGSVPIDKKGSANMIRVSCV